VVEFGDDPASAVLMSDILTHKTTSVTPACLSLHHSVSSLDVNITVALSTSPENLSTSRQVYVTDSRHTSHYWQRSVVISAGERLFITASKLRATRRSVTYTSLSNISLTQGNCSSDSAEGKFSRIRQKLFTQLSSGPYLLSFINFCFMAAHSNGQAIIFCSCGFYLSSSFFFFSSPILSGRKLDVYHTSAQSCWP